MFDIGFAELVLVGVVGLLVIGPERLPGTIRTAAVWLNRLKRSFNDIKHEVQQELHNDEVMRDLRKTGAQLKAQTDDIKKSIGSATAGLNPIATDETMPTLPPGQTTQPAPPADKSAE